MWFRPGQAQVNGDSDRFRVSSLKSKIKRKAKSDPTKPSGLGISTESINSIGLGSTTNLAQTSCAENSTVVEMPPCPPPRKTSKITETPKSEKDSKTLLTDRKFKNNRVAKSSSKGKINEGTDKKVKSPRKISAPPVLDPNTKPPLGINIATALPVPPKKNVRSHSNLNLNALLKYKNYLSSSSSNNKRLAEETEKARRKSVTAETNNLIKSQSLDSDAKCDSKLNLTSLDVTDNLSLNGDVTRNEDDDEEIYVSCDEKKPEPLLVMTTVMTAKEMKKAKEKSSPSLTSRMAARISEASSSSKAKKAAKAKKNRKRRPSEVLGNPDERPATQPVTRQSSDRAPDVNNSISSNNALSGGGVTPSDVITPPSLDTDSNAQDAEREHTRNSSKPKSAPVSVNRSESYKETISQKRNRNNRRKTSDPSLTKVSTDEQVDLGLSNANLTQSSNSSLSSSLESTSTSLEAVGAPTAGTGTVPTARQQWIDSDEEHAGEINEVDWSSNVDAHILKTLTDQEKKRQEIINEIYITERNHVRTLKLLDGIFLKPLKESNLINSDFLTLLFPPALSTLKELHMQFESKIKQRRNDSSPLVSSIGDIIIEMFDGHIGEELKDFSAQFCCRQGVALEALKEKRRKDEHLHKLLSKQESHRACRRLQLKDLLPTVLQRLTKYPLLFESLYKITLQVLPDNEQEQLAIKKSLENSKQILDHVNQAVRIADNSHKLQTIQRKLDKSSYEKEASNEFKNLDLTQHKLVHDGPLIMKKNPGTQLHGLLFENMMVLLHKQEERYVLKYHSVPMAGSNDSKAEIRFNPITKIHLLLIRQSAVDKNTFFLINTNVSQMLELTAPSKSECKIWFKHISDAAESYKARTRGNSHEHNDDGNHGSSQKDSFESSALDHSQPPPTPIITPEPIKNSQDNNENLNNNNSVNNNTNNIYENNQIINSNISNDSSSKTDINIHEDDDDGDDNSDNEDDKIIGDTNSNETRTLTQQCSLVAPCEVQININPAHTAEPVITPAERLRRLDDSIRTTLMEKQRIVCDMFRVPNEHFEAIADIAGQPEASKKTSFQEPSDIVLAAFAQVQSLTEILNECIKVTTHQEISAVSTSLCDVCYRGQKEIKVKTNTCVAMTTATSTTNKISHLLEKGSHVLVEDEDGYCEIDELRIPTIPSLRVTPTNFPPLPPLETSTPNTPTSPTTVISNQSSTNPNMPNTQASSNDAKRQSTVSADSIPEETEHEINALLPPSIEIPNESEYSFCDTNEAEQNTSSSSLNNSNLNNNSNNDDFIVDDDVPTVNNSYSNILSASESHNIECINDTYDSASQMSELNQDDESTLRSQSQETQRLADNLMELCGTNRLAHVQSLVPSIPCHLITGYVTMLNEQITRLLPKLEERDVERDQLRKENQHLRELLNSKYEKERVSESDETLLIDNNSSFDEPQTSQQKHSQKEDPNSSSLSTE